MRPASELRAANQDRQAVVDRLQGAFVEGRLQLHEYDERVALAYQAVTYADLAALFADLPDDNPIALPAASRPAASGPGSVPAKSPARQPSMIGDLPLALQILWTIWISVVLINLVVWTILEVSQGSEDFWPIWLLVPGAVLLGVTFGVQGIRRDRRAKAIRRGLKAARRER
ncbi:MAG: DUF1707 domain-containing protein [Jatrophihabitantaceae bacterium]